MLVSYEHQFLFVHVPKAAGTSIVSALEPYACRPDGFWLNRLLDRAGVHVNYLGPHRQKRFRVHTPAAVLRRQVPRRVYDTLFKFAFVRNPWDRLVSYYHYVLATPGHNRHERVGRLGSFAAFVEWCCRKRKPVDQQYMLCDSGGNLIVDFVGRYETLADDFRTVCRRIGLGVSIPHLNRSRHRDYREYYGPATRDLVAELYAGDIERFGYTFEGEQRRLAA